MSAVPQAGRNMPRTSCHYQSRRDEISDFDNSKVVIFQNKQSRRDETFRSDKSVVITFQNYRCSHSEILGLDKARLNQTSHEAA